MLLKGKKSYYINCHGLFFMVNHFILNEKKISEIFGETNILKVIFEWIAIYFIIYFFIKEKMYLYH